MTKIERIKREGLNHSKNRDDLLKVMNKILITFSLLITFSFSNGIQIPNIMDMQENKEKKLYKDLISFLDGSPSGEYKMYLAIIYLNGIDIPDSKGNTINEDIKLSIEYFKKSIGLGYFKSSTILGSLFLFDDRFKKIKDFDKKAKFYLTQGLDNGIDESIMALSSYYFYYEKNATQALELLHLGSRSNLSTAQLALATTYGYGSKELKIKQDLFLGNKYLKLACENKKQTEYVKKFCNSNYIIKGE